MRADGYKLKNIDPMYKVAAYVMNKRYDAMNMVTIDIPIEHISEYLKEKRKEGAVEDVDKEEEDGAEEKDASEATEAEAPAEEPKAEEEPPEEEGKGKKAKKKKEKKSKKGKGETPYPDGLSEGADAPVSADSDKEVSGK